MKLSFRKPSTWMLPLFLVAASTGAMAQTDASYTSGGVGVADMARMAEHQAEYSLKLVFTLTAGNYISEVDVKISNGRNVTIDTVSEGPIFLAKLPPGAYTVNATYEGKKVTRKVVISGKGLRVEYLRWDRRAHDGGMSVK